MAAHLTLEQAIALRGADCDSTYRTMVLDFIEQQSQCLAARLPKPETKEAWLHRADYLRPRLIHSLGLDRLPERTALNDQIEVLGAGKKGGGRGYA